MFWGTLHRKILGELLKVFSVALIALTGLILLAGVISEAMKNGLGPMQILVAIPLLLPGLLPYTVPTTTLFATCIVYGRLAADNEILALKAAGVHILHIVWPALLLGILTSIVTMTLFLDAIPSTNFLLKGQLGDDVEELLYMVLRKDGCVRHPKINYEIHVKNVEGRVLHEAIFKRYGPGRKGFDLIACAREAELRVDTAGNRLLISMRQCQLVEGSTVGFLDDSVWPVDLPRDLNNSLTKLRAMDMTWSELDEYEEKAYQEKQTIEDEMAAHQRQIDRGKAGTHFAKHVVDLTNEFKIREHQIDAICAERNMRPALAFGCFCFALVGCPVGIWFSKSDYLSAFITCFLPIVTIYYPLMFCMFNMARAGKIEPSLSIYNADAALLIAGMFLFRRLARN